mgnify:CR=1 FL=1
MATFTYTPSFQALQSSKPRVRKFQAGDGYEQRVRFGLHTDLKEWELTFENRTDAESASIQGFLEARGGVESFTWTPPMTGANAAQFICEEWQVTMLACNLNTIHAKFREVPEP